MKLILTKTHLGIRGGSPHDQEKLDQLKNGDYTAEIKQPRNVAHHRKFFSLLNFAFGQQEEYKTIESFREAVSVAAGYCTLDKLVIKGIGEVMVCKPVSISFSKMDQSSFDVFYSRIIDTLIESFCPGQTPDEISNNAVEYMRY